MKSFPLVVITRTKAQEFLVTAWAESEDAEFVAFRKRRRWWVMHRRTTFTVVSVNPNTRLEAMRVAAIFERSCPAAKRTHLKSDSLGRTMRCRLAGQWRALQRQCIATGLIPHLPAHLASVT